MKKKYEHLLKCLSCFPRVWELDWASYKRSFVEYIRTDYIKKEDVRNDITMFLLDDSITWKTVSSDQNVFFYDEAKTEFEIFLDFRLLTWDALYPEKVMSITEMQELKNDVINLLYIMDQGESKLGVLIDDLLYELNNRIKYSALDHYTLLRMQTEIGYPDIYLQYYQTELWFFKLKNTID